MYKLRRKKEELLPSETKSVTVKHSAVVEPNPLQNTTSNLSFFLKITLAIFQKKNTTSNMHREDKDPRYIQESRHRATGAPQSRRERELCAYIINPKGTTGACLPAAVQPDAAAMRQN